MWSHFHRPCRHLRWPFAKVMANTSVGNFTPTLSLSLPLPGIFGLVLRTLKAPQFHIAVAASSKPPPPPADAPPRHPRAAKPTAPNCAEDASSSRSPAPPAAWDQSVLANCRIHQPSPIPYHDGDSSPGRISFRKELKLRDNSLALRTIRDLQGLESVRASWESCTVISNPKTSFLRGAAK